MKIVYGAVIVAMSISGLYAMDEAKNNGTKQMAAISFGSKLTMAMSSSTPSLPYASTSIVSPRASSSSSNLVSESPRTPRLSALSSPRPPSPRPKEADIKIYAKYEQGALRSFSDKKLSSSSLPTIPEKK